MSAGPRRSRAATAIVAVAVLSGLVAVAAWGAKDDLTFLSRVSGANGAAATAASYYPSVSGDGRYVAFTSYANNLSGEDVDAVYDVFVRDVQTNVLTLASRATGAGGAGGTDGSTDASISADGRYVVFSSVADNLSAVDDNLSTNIFVRDLQESTTTLVNRASGVAGAVANDTAYDPQISADGRRVTFISSADNLSTEDNNTYLNVFVRDLEANTTTLVSRAAGAAGTGADASSYNPSVSADGRYVAFQSNADNLSADDNNTYTNLFVRDLQANTLTFVSRAGGAAGAAADGGSYTPAISDSGRRVSFTSDADNLSSDDNNTYQNIFVRDLTAATTTLVSRADGATGAGAEASSDDSSISGDGRRVGFTSGANNLSAEDNNGYDNIFVRDLVDDTLTFASRAAGAAGAAGDGHSEASSLSETGRYLGVRVGRQRSQRRRQRHLHQHLPARPRADSRRRGRWRRRRRRDQAARVPCRDEPQALQGRQEAHADQRRRQGRHHLPLFAQRGVHRPDHDRAGAARPPRPQALRCLPRTHQEPGEESQVHPLQALGHADPQGRGTWPGLDRLQRAHRAQGAQAGALPGHAACHGRRRQPIQRQAAQVHRSRALRPAVDGIRR